MIEVKELTKFYGPRAAIADLTFTLEQGRILGLLGPNGAGKTTTMRILTGYMPPSSGVARVAGCDAFRDSLALRRHIGYLPERVPLYEDMTVDSYLQYCGRIHGVKGVTLGRRVREIVETCNAGEFHDRLIGKLSRGQRQRVGIAQALIHDPDVVILDEPTVGLDPRQIIETRQLIKSLGGRHTVVLSSHILPEVNAIADEVVIIHEGHVVAQDSPANLTQRLQGEQRYHLTVRGPLDDIVRTIKEQEWVRKAEGRSSAWDVCELTVHAADSTDIREQLAALIVTAGWGLRELTTTGLSLEEVYLKLTTEEEIEAA
ncbi:MAG: ABC transporter ATP-binding protein [Chloroflexi bacterium]|nr:ABC transporter ATP-binding protein [Chloroflexota bacterium]